MIHLHDIYGTPVKHEFQYITEWKSYLGLAIYMRYIVPLLLENHTLLIIHLEWISSYNWLKIIISISSKMVKIPLVKYEIKYLYFLINHLKLHKISLINN